MMAETEKSSAGSDGKDSASYKPPPPKSLKELQDLDKDDESLNKYKRSLLGDDVDLTAGLFIKHKCVLPVLKGLDFKKH